MKKSLNIYNLHKKWEFKPSNIEDVPQWFVDMCKKFNENKLVNKFYFVFNNIFLRLKN